LKKTKAFFFLIILFAITLCLTFSVMIKNGSVKSLYEDVTFTQVTTEAKQYTAQIEYGLKYGRELDNFYNIDDTLTGIQQCSSYIEGVYIVSADNLLLYQKGAKSVANTLYVNKEAFNQGNKIYDMYENGGKYYIVSQITGSSGIAGYLILRVSADAISNSVAGFDRQNLLQSVLIGGEIVALCLFALRRAKLSSKFQSAFFLIKLLSVSLVCFVLLDSGVAVLRYYQIVDNAATQTVNKIAQALQGNVDEVMSKVVTSENIYDINDWLQKNEREMPIVASLSADKNNIITAKVSQKYVNNFLEQSVLSMSMLLAGCILFCILTFLLTALTKRKLKTG